MTQEGRILALSGGRYRVRTDDGEDVVCVAKGAFRKSGIHPVVGDLVLIEPEEAPSGEKRGLITEIQPRKNVLIRPPLANLDTIFPVVSVREPEPVLLSVDKLLAIATHNHIRTVIVLTKKDLDPARTQELFSLYTRAGFPVVATTRADSSEAKSLLLPYLKNSVSAMAGASGAGKSTLINSLFPSLAAETGDLSEKTGRGKHTTRECILYDVSRELDAEGPCFLADTPGFSLLDFDQFFFMEKEDLPFSFPDFSPFLGQCKFTKCSHTKEDGCRILEEMRQGRIAESRHQSYLTLWDELSKTQSWELSKKRTKR